MGNIGEIAAELGAAATDVEATRVVALDAMRDGQRTAQDVAHVTAGTNRSEPGAVIKRLHAACARLEEAVRLMGAGTRAISDYLAQIAADIGVEALAPTSEQSSATEQGVSGMLRRLHRETVRRTEDITDVTGKTTKLIEQVFKPSGPTMAEVRTPDTTVVQPPPQNVGSDQAATAILVTGVLLGKVAEWSYGKIRKFWRRRRADDGSG